MRIIIMDSLEKRAIVDEYIRAYNSFDINGMMELLHPDIEFQNISAGQVNAAASGAGQFRQLAEQGAGLFRSRCQTITHYAEPARDAAHVAIAYEAELAIDLPNGMKAGDRLSLTGRSEFRFRDGKIAHLVDHS